MGQAKTRTTNTKAGHLTARLVRVNFTLRCQLSASLYPHRPLGASPVIRPAT